jgi:hypothetical protein
MNILNLTELPDDQANEIISEYRSLILRGEGYIQPYRDDAEKYMRAWRGELWTQQDLDFFAAFDITPMQFKEFRPYFNQLIANQRTTRFKYELVTRDPNSYRRFQESLKQFLEQNEEKFVTTEEAIEYFEEFGDDEYALAVTAILDVIRDENKAKYVESDVFENGLITGADFIKSHYGNKNNREGSIVFTRRSLRNMFWDDNSVEYDLSDAEFIGEIHTKYVDELVQMYPDFAEEVAEHFEKYTNKQFASRVSHLDKDFSKFYQWDSPNEGVKAKIAEVWTLESEERFEVFDNEENTKRIADFGLTEDEIYDALLQGQLALKVAELERLGDYEAMADPNLESEIRAMVDERYEIRGTIEPIWYKAVVTYDAVLEYERSPYPHGKHPYSAFFPQYTDGFFTSLMGDLYDVIIALNKGLMFREMIMAHGAKGMLVVNADVMAQSGYNLDEVADAYTQLGSIMMIKLKPGQRLDNVFLQQTTLDKGLMEITALIQDYDRRLQHISGVTPAQLGVTQGETPASRYRQQVLEGQQSNNLIFDNFVRTLELFYAKVIPLVIEMMQQRPEHVIRAVGDHVRPWVSLEMNQNFGVFADALRTGHFSLTVVPQQDDPRTNAARDAQYMQLAMAGAFPIETAIRVSNDPRKGIILREMRKDAQRKMMEDAASMVNIQTVQQIAAEMGLGPEAARELATKLQKARYAEMNQQEQQQTRVASGMGAIQGNAQEDTRMESVSPSPT